MNCPNCGAPAKEGALFCKSCGTRIAEQPTLEFITPDLDQFASSADQGAPAPERQGVSGSQPSAADRRAEREAKRQANAQVKEAKAAYKSARKAAGKSAAPKVIAVIVAILVVAGAGAAAMWYFNPVSPAASSSSSQTSSSAEASSSAATSSDAASSSADSSESSSSAASSSALSSDASSSEASAIAKNYLGIWSGDMTETSASNFYGYKCYGARNSKLVLEIAEFEATGRVSANVTTLVHAHDSRDLDRDVDSHEGDQVVELTKLTGTYNNGSIAFKGDTSKGIEVNVSVKTDDSSGSQRHLLVTVEANGFTDVYKLAKES